MATNEIGSTNWDVPFGQNAVNSSFTSSGTPTYTVSVSFTPAYPGETPSSSLPIHYQMLMERYLDVSSDLEGGANGTASVNGSSLTRSSQNGNNNGVDHDTPFVYRSNIVYVSGFTSQVVNGQTIWTATATIAGDAIHIDGIAGWGYHASATAGARETCQVLDYVQTGPPID